MSPSLQCQAGLDAMLFQFSFTNSSFTNVSPVFIIPAAEKRYPLQRAARSPMSDKSRDDNATAACITPFSPKPIQSSFQPLPPLPSDPAISLPHIFHSSASTPRHDPSPASPPSRLSPTQIQALSHPNSPYVPWSGPAREQAIQSRTTNSLVSPPPSPYSRPLSRSGAMAPEPTNYSQCDMHNHYHLTNGFSQLHNSWRSFRRTVNKGIRKVVKRIGRINEQRKTTQHTSPEPDWEEVSPPVSFDRTHSRHRSSVASTQTNSLATWLSERRRLSIEQERLARRLTLAEYEDSGSWLELEATQGRARDSGTSDSDPDSPGCDEESIFQPAVYDLLTPGLISCGVATVSTDHRDSVLFTLQQLDELELDNESFVIPPPLHRTTSSPELASSPHRPYRHASPSSRSLCGP